MIVRFSPKILKMNKKTIEARLRVFMKRKLRQAGIDFIDDVSTEELKKLCKLAL